MRLFMWSATNCFLVAFLYFGLFEGIEWCKNVGLFFVWLSFSVNALLWCSQDFQKHLKQKGPVVNQYINIIVSLIQWGIIAASGMFVTAVCVCIGDIVQLGTMYGDEQTKHNNK